MDKLIILSDKDEKFAYAFLSDRESYHSHKETSAYTIFAVEAAFFGALVTTEWFARILRSSCSPKLIAFTFIVPIWVLVHIFMRWQLTNRRIAALQVGTILTALLDHLKGVEDDSKVGHKVSQQSGKKITWKMRLLNLFVPVYSATVKGDLDLERFPDWYTKRYVAFQEKGTGALTGEWFPTIGSLLILFYLGIYVIFLVK
jgi:hypothetical protein